MSEIIEKIIADVKNHYSLEHDDEELQAILFFRPNSVRLSYTGYLKVKKIYTEYKFPTINFNNSDLIKIYRNSAYPYYMGGKSVSVFDGEDAFAIKLYGGLRSWLDTL